MLTRLQVFRMERGEDVRCAEVGLGGRTSAVLRIGGRGVGIDIYLHDGTELDIADQLEQTARDLRAFVANRPEGGE